MDQVGFRWEFKISNNSIFFSGPRWLLRTPRWPSSPSLGADAGNSTISSSPSTSFPPTFPTWSNFQTISPTNQLTPSRNFRRCDQRTQTTTWKLVQREEPAARVQAGREGRHRGAQQRQGGKVQRIHCCHLRSSRGVGPGNLHAKQSEPFR